MAMERVSVEGREGRDELAVRVFGDGPPVLLVHGIPGSSGSWVDVVPRYAEVEETLPLLGKPVLVLWGDRDPFFSLEEGRRAASAIPGAELRVAEGAGHFLPAERPKLFSDAVAGLSSAVELTRPDARCDTPRGYDPCSAGSDA